MADWANVRMMATGPVRAVNTLRREAKPFVVFANGSRNAYLPRELLGVDALFDVEMLRGEGGNLFEHSYKRLAVGAVLQFGFQTARVDEVAHFKTVSKRFPTLRFVVGWRYPSGDETGSAFISKGRAKKRRLSRKKAKEIYSKFIPDPDAESDDTFWLEWEADEEMLDHCMELWNAEIFQDGGKRRVRPQIRRL